jgi:hypothetical protein
MTAVITIHNVMLRNWENVFGTTPPALFSASGLALEAIVFSAAAMIIVYAVLKCGDGVLPTDSA